jgi:hypothetical protein
MILGDDMSDSYVRVMQTRTICLCISDFGTKGIKYDRPGGFIVPTSFPFGWREYESYLPLAHDTGVYNGESMLSRI